jgi:hypothetical protein
MTVKVDIKKNVATSSKKVKKKKSIALSKRVNLLGKYKGKIKMLKGFDDPIVLT